jgi:hypothetical protein
MDELLEKICQHMNNNIVSIEDVIAIAIVIFISIFIVLSIRKKETESRKNTIVDYMCCGCSKKAKHSYRTLSAQERGTTRFFCNNCHPKWVKTRPPLNEYQQQTKASQPIINDGNNRQTSTSRKKATYNNIQPEFSAYRTMDIKNKTHEHILESELLAEPINRLAKPSQYIKWAIPLAFIIVIVIVLTR